MIKLDNNYKLRNNTVHGVELVFEETRQKKNKKTEVLEDYIFEDVWYFPNSILALNKWIGLTNNSTDLTSLSSFYSAVNEKLDLIYEQFKKNGRKL